MSSKYASSHEWVKMDSEGVGTVGISDHAQSALGDIVYVELPEAGRSVSSGQEVAVVESVKSASDIYAPVSGEILEVNEALSSAPEQINADAEGGAWLFRIRLSDPAELEKLMDLDAYKSFCD